MWLKLLYAGFETCFGPSTQGTGAKTHPESRCSVILILYNFSSVARCAVHVRPYYQAPVGAVRCSGCGRVLTRKPGDAILHDAHGAGKMWEAQQIKAPLLMYHLIYLIYYPIPLTKQPYNITRWCNVARTVQAKCGRRSRSRPSRYGAFVHLCPPLSTFVRLCPPLSTYVSQR